MVALYAAMFFHLQTSPELDHSTFAKMCKDKRWAHLQCGKLSFQWLDDHTETSDFTVEIRTCATVAIGMDNLQSSAG